MGILKVAAIGAGFSVAMAGIPQATPVSSPQKLAFANSTPDVAVQDHTMKTRQYEFDVVGKGVKIKQGLYDEQLGVACSWTLVRNDSPKDKSVTLSSIYSVASHECSRGAQPTRWRASPAFSPEEMGGLHTGGTLDLYGDKSQLLQVSLDSYPQNGIGRMYTRLWDNENNQVCLKSLTVGETPFGLYTVSKIEHGCFQMDRKDFVIQRAIATQPSIAA